MPDLSNTQRSPEAIVARTDSCLTESEILDFVAGRLGSAQIEAVHTHLDGCITCQELVSVAARKSSDPRVLDDPNFNTAFRCGDVVGRRYRVHRFIARGGMGEVYEAHDLELKERVALKTVLSTASDGVRAVRRLKAEVLLARRVSHPNVCRIYDLGAHTLENGATLSFLTMEFVDGERLSDRCARDQLSVDAVQRTVRQLLLGLEAAHGAGILHRDLKTDNVMLRAATDGAIVPVIMDFGLARTIEPNAGRVTSGVNGLLGTPCYMAPEQLEGADLTTASDIYSFGVVWFEMLTRRLPFSPRAPFERLGKRPPRPTALRKEIPLGVEQIVLRCLERAPPQRYASAHDVLLALDAFEARSSPVPSPRPPERRHHVVISIALFVLVLVALGTWRSLSPTRGIATAAAQRVAGYPSVEKRLYNALPRKPEAAAERATLPVAMPKNELATKPKRKKHVPAPDVSPPSPLPAAPSAVSEAPEAPSAAAVTLPAAELGQREPASPAPRATASPEALGFANPFKRRAP